MTTEYVWVPREKLRDWQFRASREARSGHRCDAVTLCDAIAQSAAAMLAVAPALPAVDDDAQDTIDEVLNRLEGWGKAYPTDIFPPVTDDEREWLHGARRGLMDRIAASMGRHMAGCIAGDLARLRAALSGPTAQESDNTLANTQRAIIEAAELRGYRRKEDEVATEIDTLRAQLAAAEADRDEQCKLLAAGVERELNFQLRAEKAEAERDRAVKDAERLVFLADADNAADAGIYGISIGQTVDDLRARIDAASAAGEAASG